VLNTQNITKTFGPTHALKGVALKLTAGQVHALVGENGAGKSTLFKICAGVLPPDSGTMTLNGQLYAPANMRRAQQAGVALVFQEMTINRSLDIAENIFIDRLYQHSGMLGLSRWRTLRQAAQQLLDDMEADISVNQPLGALDLGQLKVLEVARALSYQPKVLLLDESTAFLNTHEIDTLFKVVNKLRHQGIAIGYISHHLDEIDKLADSITILKDGNRVGDFARGELSNAEIEGRMVGREIGSDIYPVKRIFQLEKTVLSLNTITVKNKLYEVDLQLYQGEILGIGGLKGSGGESLLRTIMGDIRPNAGNMTLFGQPYTPPTPTYAWQQGIAYLPGDRGNEGLIADFSVKTNLSMAALPRVGMFVNAQQENALVAELIQTLQIKTHHRETPAKSLSGGNLQKIVLGKCIAAQPRVLLLNNPTRGIDIGARMQIYSIIRELAEQGIAVILLSEDLLELRGMSDRIVIMRKGLISHTFGHNVPTTEEALVSQMI
jgi:ribose transport system ATP-binding protein